MLTSDIQPTPQGLLAKPSLSLPALLGMVVAGAAGAILLPGKEHWGSPTLFLFMTIGRPAGCAFLAALAVHPVRAAQALRFLGLFVVSGSIGLSLLTFRLFFTPKMSDTLGAEMVVWGVIGLLYGLGLTIVLGSVFGLGQRMPPGARKEFDESISSEAYCDRCGKLALHEAMYHRTQLSFRRRTLLLCPRCHERHRQHLFALGWLLFGGMTLLGGVLSWRFPHVVIGWMLLNWSLTGAFFFLLVVPHELGHALGTWVAGGKCYLIYIGHGLSIFSDGHWRVSRETGTLPHVLGCVKLSLPDKRWLRTRLFICFLGGPLANIALLGLILYWMPPKDLLGPLKSGSPSLMPGLAFAAANLLLVLNLVPMVISGQPSDGAVLLSCPFMSAKKVEQHHVTHLLHQGQNCLRRGQVAEARLWYERCQALYPGEPCSSHGLAQVLFLTGEAEKARTIYHSLTSREDVLPAVRQAARDSLAIADLFLVASAPNREDRSTLIREADEVTRAVLAEAAMVPSQLPSFLATRGAVMVESGDLVAGATLLGERQVQTYPVGQASRLSGQARRLSHRVVHLLPVALERVQPELDLPADQAICSCYLALAFARLGQEETGRHHLEQARSFDKDSVFLRPILQALSALALRKDAPNPVLGSQS